jgi:hypothetical protein
MKLKVEELENRIAPGYGLFSFLSNLAQADSEFGAIFNEVVDGETGEVDVDGAVDMWNSAGGTQVEPVDSDFTLTDNTVISEGTANTILSLLGR